MLKNIIVPTESLTQFNHKFVCLFAPLGLLRPVFILYKVSSKASTYLLPYCALNLLRLSGVKIASTASKYGCRYSFLVSVLTKLTKSVVIVPAFQPGVGEG